MMEVVLLLKTSSSKKRHRDFSKHSVKAGTFLKFTYVVFVRYSLEEEFYRRACVYNLRLSFEL